MAYKVQPRVPLDRRLPGAAKHDQALREHAFLLNRALLVDGGQTLLTPLMVPTYTLATMPLPGAFPGGIIFVSNAGTGAVGQFFGSTGTQWVAMSLKGSTWDQY